VKSTRLAVAALLAWVLSLTTGFAPARSAPTTAPTTSATTPASAPKDALRSLRSQAWKHLLEGRFREGLRLLDRAVRLRPDPLLTRAKSLTAEYLRQRSRAEQQRREELAAARRRVRLGLLAEAHRRRLAESKAAERLFKAVEVLADEIAAADRLDLSEATSQPARVRKIALEHLSRAGESLTTAESLVADERGEWGRAFRAAAATLRRKLAEYGRAWSSAKMPADRGKLKDAFTAVQEALLDVGVLASRDPIVAALSHARDAKGLMDPGQPFLQQEWVRRLIRAAERRGQELIRQKRWSEALRIYGGVGLSDLDHDKPAYREVVKRIERHVRIVNLYGSQPAAVAGAEGGGSKPLATTTTAPTAAGTSPVPVARSEPRWREIIAGIDTVMVRSAINQIDDNYVRTPNHRKLAVAGLQAVKVLLETPEAAETFPALKDPQKRGALLTAVNQAIDRLRNRPFVDRLDAADALNRLLDRNAETVNLPPEVIDMEFAEGMLAELDRFSSMIWPYEEEEFRKRTLGSFYGIGVQIRKDKNKPIEVVTPLAGTPAFKARIRAGDWIVAVDGMDTAPMSIHQAVKRITGPRHTKVTLTIQRAGLPRPFDVVIERDEIHIQTVKGWRRLPDGDWDYFLDRGAGIGYVRLTQFTGDTPEELRKALASLRAGRAKGVILDLRFNPGGLLPAAIQVSDEFLRRGLIVRTKGRNTPALEKSATPVGEFQRGKVIVLINQFSASAAEIVAGALKDWGRAKIVGTRSYGKGSVQRLIPLRSRRARLKLTTAYYYLPSGRCLHRTNGSKVWGVDPDVYVPVTPRQMNRWAEIRQETDLLKSVDAHKLSALLDEQLRRDLQLQTALLLMRLELLSEQA